MRNLKLGDNLSGKTLYFNFSEDWYNSFTKNYEDIILVETEKYQIIASSFGANYFIRLYDKETDISENVYYNDDIEGNYHPESYKLPSDMNKVLSLNTSIQLYQFIKIDPKIVIIVDTQPKSSPSENKKKYTLYTEELNSNGDVSDLLEINYNQVKLTRKIGIDESGNKYVLEEPVIEEFELEIVLFKGNNYIYVEETDYSKLSLEYYTDNPANEEFARVKEVEALIKVTDEITSQVSKKIDGTEVVSVINQSAEQITIKGNRFVVDSTNFKLTADGTLTATNGNFKGVISSSTITGSVIKLIGSFFDGKLTLENEDGSRKVSLGCDGIRMKSEKGQIDIITGDSATPSPSIWIYDNAGNVCTIDATGI